MKKLLLLISLLLFFAYSKAQSFANNYHTLSYTAIKDTINNTVRDSTPDCDTVIFNDNSILLCKIVTFNDSVIKFYRCNNLDGLLYTDKISRVKTIIYSNNQRIIYKQV